MAVAAGSNLGPFVIGWPEARRTGHRRLLPSSRRIVVSNSSGENRQWKSRNAESRKGKSEDKGRWGRTKGG